MVLGTHPAGLTTELSLQHLFFSLSNVIFIARGHGCSSAHAWVPRPCSAAPLHARPQALPASLLLSRPEPGHLFLCFGPLKSPDSQAVARNSTKTTRASSPVAPGVSDPGHELKERTQRQKTNSDALPGLVQPGPWLTSPRARPGYPLLTATPPHAFLRNAPFRDWPLGLEAGSGIS